MSGAASMRAAFLLLGACVVAASAAASPPTEEVDVGGGPLSLPAGFPLELLIPSHVPLAPRVEPRGGVRLAARWHQANTLTSTGEVGRRRERELLGLAPLEGTGVLVDLESSRLTVEVAVGLGARWEAGVELSGIGYAGGVGDHLIDEVHHTLGLKSEIRDARPEDSVEIAVLSDRGRLEIFRSPTHLSLGDTLLFARRVLSTGGTGRSAWLLDMAVELPTGDEERLAGSGGVDGRIGIHGSEGWKGLHFLAWGLSWVPVGSYDAAPIEVESAWHGHLGYERRWASGWSLPAQLVLTDSHFRDAGNADGPRALLQAGVRAPLAGGRGSWELGFSQNLTKNDNQADFALATGITWSWGGAAMEEMRR